MIRSTGGLLAFLDLMCCSFGGALLLFLLMASANPEPLERAQRNRMMVVRCVHQGGPKPEIRLECRRPGRVTWQRLDRLSQQESGLKVFFYSAPAEKEGGGDSFALIFQPAVGTWEFRAFLHGFPKDQPVGPVLLQIEVDGDDIDTHTDIGDRPVPIWPGQYSPVVRATVRSYSP